MLEPLIDPERAIDGAAADPSRRQRASATSASCAATSGVVGDVVVEGTYEIGMQDQAFLGLEAALALPDRDGAGVELFIATQWLHEDRKQIAACLGLPEERCASRSAASAARSAPARTSACRCTRACSRCAPGGR